MKLYEVNQMIEGIFEQLVDPETGEIVENEALLAQLDSLQMERSRILEYLAKLVLNTRSQMAALKEEEKRLKERRASLVSDSKSPNPKAIARPPEPRATRGSSD